MLEKINETFFTCGYKYTLIMNFQKFEKFKQPKNENNLMKLFVYTLTCKSVNITFKWYSWLMFNQVLVLMLEKKTNFTKNNLTKYY